MTTPELRFESIPTSFVITSMPVGGAETLLVNLIRRLDHLAFQPEVVCLKEPGPLGEEIRSEFNLTSNYLASKWDLRVLPRLVHHFRKRKTQAVVTVGAGDKMFWGRLAAKIAGVPVIASALHSTGWPDGVGRANRWLTGITDAFIAVAKPHGEFLVDFEKFPREKVAVIPNGIDTHRFQSNFEVRSDVRKELNIPIDAPVVGIVAALRAEKNHALFIDMAKQVLVDFPTAHFIIIGDGPEREFIQQRIASHGIASQVHLLGTRSDTQRLLAAMDLFALTSHNEANPVSILEALSCQVPVVATNVGSVKESVQEERTGCLVEPGNVAQFKDRVVSLLSNPSLRQQYGEIGRQYVVECGSVDSMVRGYEELIARIYRAKRVGKEAFSTSPSCQGMVSKPSF